MKRKFDQTKLQSEDYVALFEAVKRAAYKDNVEYGYIISNVILSTRCIESIVAQIGTRGKVTINREPSSGLLGKLGLEDIYATVDNPVTIVPEVMIGSRKIHPSQIVGYGPGNQYDALVDFEHGDAMFKEEDQDLAHRLGFVYTPKGMIDMFSLKGSSQETHRTKKQIDETGNPLLYCDNLTCQRLIRNPILVMDSKTGGIYHSEICEARDAQAKHASGVKEFSPAYILIEEVRALYREGRVQQAPGFQAV
ncbi:hypothetical protein HZC31_07035 [Candidatus Woesearchaeota archaeon]|nr:hypothetical protein [Candidatus Woesearchaeota archaeon]